MHNAKTVERTRCFKFLTSYWFVFWWIPFAHLHRLSISWVYHLLLSLSIRLQLWQQWRKIIEKGEVEVVSRIFPGTTHRFRLDSSSIFYLSLLGIMDHAPFQIRFLFYFLFVIAGYHFANLHKGGPCGDYRTAQW